MDDRKTEPDSKTRPLVFAAVAVAVGFTLLLTAACGSSEIESTTKSNAHNRSGNSSNQNNSSATNNEAQRSETADANLQSPMNRKLQRIEQLRAKAANSSGEPPLPVTARPAAENSEITVELRDVARETRTFKSHPTILRLEKVSNGRQAAVAVTLKDGRRVELPGESVKSVESVTTAELLRLVENSGNQASQTKRPQRAKKETQ